MPNCPEGAREGDSADAAADDADTLNGHQAQYVYWNIVFRNAGNAV